MSETATAEPEPIAGDVPGSRQPVILNDCFGWLHAGPHRRGAGIAVLLLPGLNRDALDAHQPLRVLADAFAGAGYPTLRFDYPGTGDSCDVTGPEGGEHGPAEHCVSEHWAVWQQSVQDAASWLRRATGARQLVICGLRLGAMLATLAAARRDDVAALVLLAPVLRGQSYMRQLQMEARLQRNADPAASPMPSHRQGPAEGKPEGLEFHELQLSAATVARIARVDLRRVVLARGQPVAIFAQSASSLLADCVQVWTGQGVAVASAGFDGLEPLLRHNQETEGSPADFSAILDWVRRAAPVQPASLPRITTGMPPGASALLAGPGWRETPLLFGPDERLFGMLCRPDNGHTDRAVVICNTGRDPHYGFARFGVGFARGLARAGIAALRIDFSGLGDSIGAPGREDVVSPMFETDRTADIGAAIDRLHAIGFRRFALHGLCAGAYHALHGALADRRVDTLLLVNMPVFLWRAGDTVDFVHRKALAPGRYLRRIGRTEIWQRLLQGRLDLAGILRAQRVRLSERLRGAWSDLAARFGGPPPETFARQAMAELSRRGVRTLFLFAPEDDGISAVEQEFGPRGAGLADGASMRVVAGLDHMLSGPAMRLMAADLMLDFLDVAAVPRRPGAPFAPETRK